MTTILEKIKAKKTIKRIGLNQIKLSAAVDYLESVECSYSEITVRFNGADYVAIDTDLLADLCRIQLGRNANKIDRLNEKF